MILIPDFDIDLDLDIQLEHDLDIDLDIDLDLDLDLFRKLKVSVLFTCSMGKPLVTNIVPDFSREKEILQQGVYIVFIGFIR